MEIKTLVERTAEHVIEYIQQQQLGAGARLPTEVELVEMLSVSRNTLREALKMLASRNVLDIRQGAGTFVSDKMGCMDDPLGLGFCADKEKLTRDLLEVRCILEPALAALAAQNATDPERELLEQLCRAVEQAIDHKDDFTKADQMLHAHIACCSHNQIMSNLIPTITQGVGYFATQVSHEYEQTRASHRQIVNAILEHRGADAQQAMLFHLLYNQNRFEASRDE